MSANENETPAGGTALVQAPTRAAGQQHGGGQQVAAVAFTDPTLEFVQNLAAFERVAAAIARSGMVKDRQPEAVLAKIIKGRELGLPAFAAQEVIYFFDGKTTVAAHAQLGIASARLGVRTKILHSDSQRCEIVFTRPGWEPVTAGFTLDEAKAAGLLGKDNWRKYQADMLYVRTITRGLKRIAPEVFAGIYDPDEVGAVTATDGAILMDDRSDVTAMAAEWDYEIVRARQVDAAVVLASLEQLAELRVVADQAGAKYERWLEDIIKRGLPEEKVPEVYHQLKEAADRRAARAEGNGHGGRAGGATTGSEPSAPSSASPATAQAAATATADEDDDELPL